MNDRSAMETRVGRKNCVIGASSKLSEHRPNFYPTSREDDCKRGASDFKLQDHCTREFPILSDMFVIY